MKKGKSALVSVSFVYGIALFLCVTSCARLPGGLLIMQGNFLNSRGMYTEAIASYIKALEYEDAAPYAGYALGSVYYMIDENKAALQRFAEAQELLESRPPEEHGELRFRLHYNTGEVLFSEGDFAGAAAAFREALRTDSGRIEAKRNLELSLLLQAKEPASGGGGAQDRMEAETRSAIFEYMRQKEIAQWQSREWSAGEENTGPDY